MKKNLILGVAAVFVIVMGNPLFADEKIVQQRAEETKPVIREVSVDALKKMLDAKDHIVLLDVREPDEFATGHLPGAINIPRGLLASKASMMLQDKDVTIIVYCATDRRSRLAYVTMLGLGYKHVLDLAGGLIVWTAAGYQVEK